VFGCLTQYVAQYDVQNANVIFNART